LATSSPPWRSQRTMIFAMWIGFGILAVIALVVGPQISRLPGEFWQYLPPGKGSPATLGPWTTASATIWLLIGVGVYFVPLVVLTLIWFRVRSNVKKAATPMGLAFVASVIGLFFIYTVVLNVVPQLGGVPETESVAHGELRNSSVLTALVFLALAVGAVGAGHLLSKRFLVPSAAGQEANAPSADLVQPRNDDN
jgi:hypothetical protein